MDAHGWDERYAAADLVWSASANQFVVAELADLPAGHAYDMACGEGRNAIWLAQRGWTVVAADFSAVALDKGARLAAAAGADLPIEWRRSDVTTLGPEPDSYDLVIVAYLQLPAAQRGVALRSGVRALRPGGTLFVVGHDSSNLTEGYGGPQDASVLFTAEDVLADIAEIANIADIADLGDSANTAGTATLVERATRVAREVATEDGTRRAWDALVRIRRSG